MFTLLPPRSLSGYYELLKHDAVTRLGHIGRVLIGIVTGANSFFIINRQTAKQMGMSLDQLSLILSKFRFAPGLILRTNDLIDAYENEERCLLVNRRSIESAVFAIKRYLNTFPNHLIEENATFAKRSVWHSPDDGKIPDGFLPYMNHLGPRLVLNSARVNSTNTVHRLYFKPSTTIAEENSQRS